MRRSAMRPWRVRSARASLPCGRWSSFFADSANCQPCPYFLRTVFMVFLIANEAEENMEAATVPDQRGQSVGRGGQASIASMRAPML
eukprot:4886669-Pleurochrysis_carterae.AAC.2